MLAALIIVFREVLEAGLIIGVVLAASRGVPGRGRAVGLGVLAGLVGSVIVALFAAEISQAFAGRGQEIFNAAILAVAVAMLTWHVVWMSSHGRAMATEMREVGHAVRGGRRPVSVLSVVVGVAVLREGAGDEDQDGQQDQRRAGAATLVTGHHEERHPGQQPGDAQHQHAQAGPEPGLPLGHPPGRQFRACGRRVLGGHFRPCGRCVLGGHLVPPPVDVPDNTCLAY